MGRKTCCCVVRETSGPSGRYCRVKGDSVRWREQEETAMKKYIVTLPEDERASLTELGRTGKAAAYKITHARVLLKAASSEGGPAWTDGQIKDALDVSCATAERL